MADKRIGSNALCFVVVVLLLLLLIPPPPSKTGRRVRRDKHPH